MADDPDSFKATIDNWVKQTPERILAVFKQSAQKVASLAIVGPPGVPIDTGFARASVRASLSEMPAANQEQPPKPKDHVHGQIIYPYDGSQISLTIANAKIDSTIFIGFTAAYALALEYGHSSQAPTGFLRVAAEQWPQIVAQVSAQLKDQVSLRP